MNQYKRIGIDTSKAVFTLHGIDWEDRPILSVNLRRPQMAPFFRKLPPTVVALEACASSTIGLANSKRSAKLCVLFRLNTSNPMSSVARMIATMPRHLRGRRASGDAFRAGEIR